MYKSAPPNPPPPPAAASTVATGDEYDYDAAEYAYKETGGETLCYDFSLADYDAKTTFFKAPQFKRSYSGFASFCAAVVRRPGADVLLLMFVCVCVCNPADTSGCCCCYCCVLPRHARRTGAGACPTRTWVRAARCTRAPWPLAAPGGHTASTTRSRISPMPPPSTSAALPASRNSARRRWGARPPRRRTSVQGASRSHQRAVLRVLASTRTLMEATPWCVKLL